MRDKEREGGGTRRKADEYEGPRDGYELIVWQVNNEIEENIRNATERPWIGPVIRFQIDIKKTRRIDPGSAPGRPKK